MLGFCGEIKCELQNLAPDAYLNAMTTHMCFDPGWIWDPACGFEEDLCKMRYGPGLITRLLLNSYVLLFASQISSD